MSRDKVTEAMVQALKQALAHADEQRLFRSGKLEGLFPSRSGANAIAAERAIREELLEVTRTEDRGKTTFEWVRITPRGVDFLHEHESPIHALRDLKEALQLNREALPVWMAQMQERIAQMQVALEAEARQWQHQLEALALRVEEALQRLERAVPVLPEELLDRYPWALSAVGYLDRRGETGDRSGSCPLPELFAAILREHEEITLAEFHEGLKRLKVQRVIRLLPSENGGLPEPEHALFDGSQIYYFAARDA